ncbi:beta-xylosidase/alpha-l-arabinosidase [Planotetraspora kaengkrachanensis]|uniref:Beta-glucosidase n=1 Tax=Planotetraspora kaengkrachanensis TaxID=575193 RepID=A0A8J3PRD9_9ACTN|nr:glycoside hydrolase family 3 N-terminal domain-containing protein [Planotetraspora kaengkrachanensis]GIG79097.1 beta-glucosidase [Planotetraspora kaengkrachanensis]
MALSTEPSPKVWKDAAVPDEERVEALMARMSVAEKVAQLYGVWVGIKDEDGEMAPHQHEFTSLPVGWDELVKQGIGQLTRPFGTTPVGVLTGAATLANAQRSITAAGRWEIPALVHEEILTGLAAWKATVYPSPLCWGASFDPDLVERMGAQIGATMRRLGVHQGLAPVLDVARDLRWGRVEETIGEDPVLVGTIGSAYIRGVQSAGVVATLKHFVGYSASKAGRNLAPVSAGRREIADVLLPPFEMALRAGADSVMNSYADIDGVPVAADPGLLTDLLRDTYGFTGTVVADYFSVAFLQTLHNVAESPGDAARLALTAGIDVELPTVNTFGPPLIEAIERGEVDPALVDRALRRVLLQKCRLGLLDEGWDPEPSVLREEDSGTGDAVLDGDEQRALAGELARRSVVLLRNTGTLPLAPRLRLAVVGPRADTPQAMMGCYSFPMHVGVHHPDVPVGLEVPTLVEALRADPAGYDVRYAQGVPVLGGDDEGIAAAVAAAAEADVCVAVLGDQAGLFGRGTSGEGCDTESLRLPGRQEELLEAVLATGTPVVLVLLVGRPYELARQVERLAAVVCGFFPGEEGARALADVLSGRADPAGRLPVSFPGDGATQPSTYLAAPLARRSEVSSVDPTALFPFGHGLSYTPITWKAVSAGPAETWPTDGTFDVRVTLSNEAAGPVSEVVQVYLHDPVAEVARPVQSLLTAPRVDLEPGETREVTISLHADQTSYTGAAGRRQVDPGVVELRIGASSADIRETVSVTMTGPRRHVGFDRVMEATVTSAAARN